MKQLQLVLLNLLIVAAMVAPPANAGESGKALYKTYCWQCHGMNADGMGVNIRDMSVQPRDHTDTKKMAARSDDELFKVIKEGGQAISKSVLMPAWQGVLSDDEIHSLVRYLRELCNCQQ